MRAATVLLDDDVGLTATGQVATWRRPSGRRTSTIIEAAIYRSHLA